MSIENDLEDLRRRLASAEAKIEQTGKDLATLQRKADSYSNWMKVLSVIAAALGIGALSLWHQAITLHDKYSVLNGQFAEVERKSNALMATLPAEANRILTDAAPRVLEGNVQHFIRDDVDVFFRAQNTGNFVTSNPGNLFNGLMARGRDQAFRINTIRTPLGP